MPRKGSRATHTVTIAYPGQDEITRACFDFDSAEHMASDVAQRGGTATVGRRHDGPVTADAPLSAYGPGITHTPTRAPAPASAPQQRGAWFACTCGTARRNRLDTEAHLSQAGLCGFCAGTTTVTRRADDQAVPCPVCDGTGDGQQVSYHEVDTGAYITATRQDHHAA